MKKRFGVVTSLTYRGDGGAIDFIINFLLFFGVPNEEAMTGQGRSNYFCCK